MTAPPAARSNEAIIGDTATAIKILRGINFIDSELFGLTVDLFKVRLLVNTEVSPAIKALGLDPGYDLVGFDFRLVENLKFDFHMAYLGPAYLEDGDLSAGGIAAFSFDPLDIRKAGSTCRTDRMNVYRDMVEVYEVDMLLNYGSISFRFSDLSVATYPPEDFDR